MTQVPFNLEFTNTLRAQTQPGLIQLKSFTLLSCEGPDAAQFLQGQLTCDIESLQTAGGGLNTASLGSCCTPQGRMISAFHIAKLSPTHFWLFLPKANYESCFNHLKKYSIFSKVTLAENPDNEDIYGLITASGNSPIQHRDTELKIFPLQDINSQLYIMTCPHNHEVEMPSIHLTEEFWRLGLMLSGLPLFDETISGEYLPADLHFDDLGGVSYNKGCYTGQEPIARMHFKGKAKFMCQLASWPKNEFNNDSAILMNEEKKRSNCSIYSTENEIVGLIRIRIDCYDQLEQNALYISGFQEKAELLNLAYNKNIVQKNELA